jgi:hypothetical protein
VVDEGGWLDAKKGGECAVKHSKEGGDEVVTGCGEAPCQQIEEGTEHVGALEAIFAEMVSQYPRKAPTFGVDAGENVCVDVRGDKPLDVGPSLCPVRSCQ